MNISVLPRIPLNKKDTDENNGCPDNKMAFNPQMLRMTKDSKSSVILYSTAVLDTPMQKDPQKTKCVQIN